MRDIYCRKTKITTDSHSNQHLLVEEELNEYYYATTNKGMKTEIRNLQINKSYIIYILDIE